MDRRSFLRWTAVVSAGGSTFAAWPEAASAQHHHGGTPHAAPTGEHTLVFAAATLKPALDEIARAYKASGGSELNIAYGPTPVLAKNIVDGAPADVFFSADARWMDHLAERNLIRHGTRVDIVGN